MSNCFTSQIWPNARMFAFRSFQRLSAQRRGLGGDINLASSDGMPDALHTDAVPEGHTTESRALVRKATIAFERIRGYALPRAESRDLIMKVANDRWKQ
jgi:hypothetical protein